MIGDMLIRAAGSVTTGAQDIGPRPAPSQPKSAPAPESVAIMVGSGKVEPQGGKDSPEAQQVVDTQAVEAAVDRLNDFVSSERRNLQFSVDEYTGRTVVTVMDAETGDVVRQIPGEEVLKLARALDEMGIRLIDVRS